MSRVKGAQKAVSPTENKFNCFAFASSPTVGRADLTVFVQDNWGRWGFPVPYTQIRVRSPRLLLENNH